MMGVLRPELGKSSKVTRKTAQKPSRSAFRSRFSRKSGASQILLLGFFRSLIEAHLETHRNHRHEARKKLQELSRKSGDQWEEAIFEAEQLWQKMQSFVDQISKKIR